MARTAKGIQIDEDRAHQRREWRIERVGWVVMVLLVSAGLLGLFGDGPLGQARAAGDGISVAYDRLQRAAAPTEYRFTVDPALATDGHLRLRLEEVLLEEAELVSVVPEPASVATGPGYLEFAFAVHASGTPARITFRFKPTTFGRVRGEAALPGTAPVVLDQFVFP